MKENKICAVCHGEYLYCPSCKKDENKPTWMFVFCSENCHDIYEITSTYSKNDITAKEAKNRLDKLDISKLENFGDSYKKIISEISEAAKVKKINKVVINKKEDILENIPTEEGGNLDVE